MTTAFHWPERPSCCDWNLRGRAVHQQAFSPLKRRNHEHQVGVLSSGHLVVEDTRVGAVGGRVSRKTARLKRKDSPLDVGVKAAVERANGRPVEVEGLDVLVRDTSSEVGLLESRADGTHRRLRSHTRHACAPSSVAAGVEGGMNALSMATSTTSAPAAAQASMLAVEIPAVSWE